MRDSETEASRRAGEPILDSVTNVIFTRVHSDHTVAFAPDGALRFSNATHFAGSAEHDFRVDPEFFSKAPSDLHEFRSGRDLGAIKDRIMPKNLGDDVVAVIRPVAPRDN